MKKHDVYRPFYYVIEYLKVLVKKYPNDQDLGKYIRNEIIKYENDKSNK